MIRRVYYSFIFGCTAVLLFPWLGMTKERVTATEQPRMVEEKIRYKGTVDVRVIELNQAQYILGARFKAPYNSDVDYLIRPYNGKATLEAYLPLYENNDGQDKHGFTITNKYYYSMRMRERNDKDYTGAVKLFRRKPQPGSEVTKPYQFKDDDFELIFDHPITGKFNQGNEYLFVDREGLKFYIKLNFDIVFSREEIIQRFAQGKHKT